MKINFKKFMYINQNQTHYLNLITNREFKWCIKISLYTDNNVNEESKQKTRFNINRFI